MNPNSGAKIDIRNLVDELQKRNDVEVRNTPNMANDNRLRTKPVNGPKGNEEWDLRIIRDGSGRIISDRRPSKEKS